MPSCVVNGCKNYSGKTANNKASHINISYHRFPVDPDLIAQWTDIIRRNRRDSSWKHNKHTKICSAHFKDDVKHIIPETGRVTIRKTAVPTKGLYIYCADEIQQYTECSVQPREYQSRQGLSSADDETTIQQESENKENIKIHYPTVLTPQTNSSICRVCLAGNVRLHSIGGQLMETYEMISSRKLHFDGKPSMVCYICVSKLDKCRKLTEMAHKSDEILNEIINHGREVTQESAAVTNPHQLSFDEIYHTSLFYEYSSKTQDKTIYSPANNRCPKVSEFDIETINKNIKKEKSYDNYDVINFEEVMIEDAGLDSGLDTSNVKLENNGISSDSLTSDIQQIQIDNISETESDVKVKIEVYKPEDENDVINNFDVTKVEGDALSDTSEDVIHNVGHSEIKSGENSYTCFKCNILFDDKHSFEFHNMRTHKMIPSCNTRDESLQDKAKSNVEILSGEEAHSCKICGKRFGQKTILDLHLKVHSDKPYSCNVCDKSYLRAESLKFHTLTHTGENPFTCKICKKSFTLPGSLKTHMRLHTGEKPFSCKLCNKSFAAFSSLNTHMRQHTGEKPFSCTVCNKSFALAASLKLHLRKHTGEKITCKICNKSYARPSSLRAHIRQQHTRDKSLVCKICNKSYTRARYLKLHYRLHTGEKPFSCKICNKSFLLETSLKNHLRLHTGEKPFTCKVCSKSFTFSSALKVHFRRHTGEKPYSCNICEKKFISKWNLKFHTDVHLSAQQREDREKPYTCDRCGKTFLKKYGLETHMRVHTREILFTCDKCDKKFTRINSLKKHTLRHTGEKACSCHTCGKTFNIPYELNAHMRKHTGERPFACNTCDKTFMSSGQLQKHILVHTGYKPFACDMCEKTFRQLPHLKSHILIHTGERPHPCTMCDKAFKDPASLRVHTRVHTGEKPFPCDKCDKKFATAQALQVHGRTHIKGPKPFACEKCDRSFSLLKKLNQHQKRHEEGETMSRKKRDVQLIEVNGDVC